MYGVAAMSTLDKIVESPTKFRPKFAISKFAPKGFRYSLIWLLALNENVQNSWPVIPTLTQVSKSSSS
jgi:hypothetical protein